MKVYQTLSGAALFRKTYSSKFMFAAFLGTHIPLIGLIIYLMIMPEGELSKTTCFLLILGLTLVASAVTLAALHALTAPVRLAQQALSAYLRNKTLPNLPEGFNDEPGILMRQLNYAINRLHEAGNEREEIISAFAHGLRAPAANIVALTNLLQEENITETVSTYTKSIEISVNKQLDLIDSMALRWQAKTKS